MPRARRLALVVLLEPFQRVLADGLEKRHTRLRFGALSGIVSAQQAPLHECTQSRQSFGINVLGTLVVEIEAADGTVGFAVTTGGEPACYIVEKHLARFLEGRDPAAELAHDGPRTGA